MNLPRPGRGIIQQALDDSVDDSNKRRTEHNADREVYHVAAQDELFEPVQGCCRLLLYFEVWGQSLYFTSSSGASVSGTVFMQGHITP